MVTVSINEQIFGGAAIDKVLQNAGSAQAGFSFMYCRRSYSARVYTNEGGIVVILSSLGRKSCTMFTLSMPGSIAVAEQSVPAASVIKPVCFNFIRNGTLTWTNCVLFSVSSSPVI